MYGLSTQEVSAIEDTYIGSMQGKTVSGKIVSNDNKQPVPGVNILVQGTSIGTITDFDGNFSINVPSDDSILIISSLGFMTQEILVGSNTVLNISLEPDIAALDEVVVVGFGTQKKATLTGAVAQVKGDDVFRGKGTSSAALSLQGEIPGLVVTRTSSRPGNEDIGFQIRGDISVNNISPLILVDGLEIPLSQLSSINANDIESYSVIKDGSAAIFGTKAAGGVILITTKKGKRGKMQVNYKGETQLNFVQDLPLSNLQEWAQLWLRAGDNDGIDYVDETGLEQFAAPNYRFFSREELVSIIDGTMPFAPEPYFWLGQDRYLGDVNQFDAVYGTTFSERHDLSISGGNENATYRTSVGYANERSPIQFVYDGAKRYNFRTNINYKVSDLVKTDLTISYDQRKIDEPTQGVGEGVQDMYIFQLYNPLGQYYDTFGANNLLAKLDEGGRTVTDEDTFRIGGKITLDLDKYIDGVSFSYLGNYSLRNALRSERTTSVTMYDWEGNVSFTPTTLISSGIQLSDTRIEFQNHVLQANYNRSFGDHNIGFFVNAISELQQTNLYSLSRTNMLSDELDDINTGDITTQSTSGGSNAVGLVSYIGKLTYDYKETFLVEGMIRRDGTSRLAPDFRWKNFYYASGGIVLSELDFIKNTGFFDFLKLRASYGETGSTSGINAYDYISNINTGSTILGVTPSLVNTASIGGLTTDLRSWERVANTNYGIDFTVLDSRLSGTVDIFNRKNKDMLIPIQYPDILGAQAPPTNSGDFTADGYEISVNWRDKIGDLKYNVGVNLWDSQSEVTRFDGAEAIARGLNTVVEGKPLNSLYTYQTDGVLSTEEEVLAYYNQYGFVDPTDQTGMKPGTVLPPYRSADRLVPGAVRRVDVNGDGLINEDDLVFQGDANPHKSYSFNIGLEYKGFDFSAFFQGVGEQNILRTGALAYPFANWWRNQNNAYLGNTWTVDNQDAEFPAIYYNPARKTWNYGHPNDVNVVKARYLRAKVLSLGYSLQQPILDRLGINRMRVSLTGNDLFVFSNVKDGLDPENGASATQGNALPFTSTLILGLEVTF